MTARVVGEPGSVTQTQSVVQRCTSPDFLPDCLETRGQMISISRLPSSPWLGPRHPRRKSFTPWAAGGNDALRYSRNPAKPLTTNFSGSPGTHHTSPRRRLHPGFAQCQSLFLDILSSKNPHLGTLVFMHTCRLLEFSPMSPSESSYLFLLRFGLNGRGQGCGVSSRRNRLAPTPLICIFLDELVILHKCPLSGIAYLFADRERTY